MSSVPKKVAGGKLKFKGDSSAPKKKKSLKRSIDESAGSAGDAKGEEEDVPFEARMLSGMGRISSSSTAVQGHATEFMNQLHAGDAIIITHPTSLKEEIKIVEMVLSNTSIGISSGFSTDLISTCSFKFVKAPKDTETEEEIAHKNLMTKHKKEEDAFGTYAGKGGEQFVYRVKTGSAFGGYKIVTESTKSKTREDLLNMRATKKSDRFCS